MYFSYRKFLTFTFAIFAFSIFHVASADTTFSGTITGDVTWTKANSPYIASFVDIPAGASLTLQPGTIVKVTQNGTPFSVEGTLTSGSVGGEPVVITSLKDDSIGGDTNLDGTTTSPSSGDWREITILHGGVVSMMNTTIRYGGLHTNTGYSGDSYILPLIHNAGGILTLDHCILTDSGYFGILQDSGTSSVSNSVLSRITTTGILSVGGHLEMSGNTFDTMDRGIEVTVGDIAFGGNSFAHISTYAVALEGSSITFNDRGGNTGSSPLLVNLSLASDEVFPNDGLVYVVGYLAVPQGMTLSIFPGAIMKVLSTGLISVDGTLAVGSATSADKVYLTSYTDDSVGGDTNGDGGATLPARGDWRSMIFSANSHGVFQHAVVRYGGASAYGASGYDSFPSIRNNGGTLKFDHVALLDSGNYGIQQISGMATITDSELAHDGYGLVVVGGTASIHHSSIHDNATYGVYNGTANVVDATQNWWGAYGGPTHPSNPFGTGDKVTDNVDYGQWLTDVPSTGCVSNCYSNVLFLPGIEGSRLYDSSGNRRWLSANDTEADYIRMNSDGTSALPDITTKDVIDTADAQQLYTNIYKSFLAEMKTWENDYHITATTTPYDWRLSYDSVVNNGRKLPSGQISYLVSPEAGHDPYLLETLKQLATASKTGKVTIIAHSQGGLIAKALMQKIGPAETARLIDKVIFVASPQLGTPQAVATILHGTDGGIPGAISDSKVRELAQNFPGAYNLLPSDQYFHHVDDSVIGIDQLSLPDWAAKYGTFIHSIERLSNLMLDVTRAKPTLDDLGTPEIGNSALFANAQTTHAALDNWTPPAGVQLITIAGWGEETLSGIEYVGVPDCVQKGQVIIQGAINVYCVQYQTKLSLKINHVIDGDGTVVEPSAMWANGATSSTRYWVNLNDYNNRRPQSLTHPDRNHKNILEVPQLQSLVTNIITGTSSSLDFISPAAPRYDGTNSRLHFTLHSPLTLGFTDTLGNYTGSTATSTLFSIPSVTYERYGDVQWLSIPKDLAGQLVLRGTGSGSFTLDAEEVNGNTTIATTSFEGIPSATSTIVTMNINPTLSVAGSSTLIVDEDGNGTPDIILQGKQNGIVFLPVPKLSLTLTASNKSMVFGSSVPALTGTFSGFVNGDTASTSVTGNASCTTTATSTSPVGIYSITCTKGTLASDKYDVTLFATGTLTILYKWSGYLQPINDTVYNPSQTLSVFKGGSTVPVKFQLKTVSGTPVQASTSPLFLTPQKGSAISAAIDESTYSDPASSGTAFKYDPTSQQYIYNWSTKGLTAGYWYKLSAKLDDGTTQSVMVGVR